VVPFLGPVREPFQLLPRVWDVAGYQIKFFKLCSDGATFLVVLGYSNVILNRERLHFS